jgi:anti-sigma factor RsiW
MREWAVLSKRCARAREHVSLRLDGELSEFERALLAAHLARCETCRRFDADVRAVTDQVRAAPLEALAVPIALPPRRPVRAVRGLQAAVAAAAVATVGLGALLGLVQSAPQANVVIQPNLASLARGDNNTLIRAMVVNDMRAQVSRRVGQRHVRGISPLL